MYHKQLRKVPPIAPTEFIPESVRKLVLTPSGINQKYYESCVLNELKGALRSCYIWERKYITTEILIIISSQLMSLKNPAIMISYN